jgi:putative tryptophan/tyrosine transport system substrate-binding protein
MGVPGGGFPSRFGEQGFVDGRDVTIEYRWAERRFERLPVLAADLVSRRAAVIVAAGTSDAALAAKAATSTIPIVFNVGDDPIRLGLVESYNRPGGNATGTASLSGEVVGKRFSLLHELVPRARSVAYLRNPATASADFQLQGPLAAAGALGLDLHVIDVKSETDIDAAFAAVRRLAADALYVDANPFFVAQRERITALAAQSRIPTMYA